MIRMTRRPVVGRFEEFSRGENLQICKPRWEFQIFPQVIWEPEGVTCTGQRAAKNAREAGR